MYCFCIFIIAPIEVLVTEKSEYHIKLEEALKENKESIAQLPWNSSSLIELRTQANYLIRELTSEIQREYKEGQELGRS
jgi:CRISPR/Cas system-associated protein Csx1